MGMLHFFPEPMPGETIHSLVSRYHLLTGSESVSRTLIAVFGKTSRTLDSDFPCCLGEIQVVGVDRLISEHTMLPLFEPFLGVERSRCARLAMSGSTGNGLKMSLGVTAAGLERYKVRRFCPQCICEDYERLGVSYWHVIHQATGVLVCPFHHCVLRAVLGIPSRDLYRDLRLADDELIIDSAIPYELTPVELKRMTNVAQLIHWGLTHPTEVASLLARDFLRAQIRLTGFLVRGRLKWESFQRYLRVELETYPQAGEFHRIVKAEDALPSWVYSILRPRSRAHHPFFYYSLLELLHVKASQMESFLQEHPVPNSVRPSNAGLSRCLSFCQAELDRHREAFVAEAQRKGIRQASGYWWQYRYDRQWLIELVAQQPKRPRIKQVVDWAARDALLCVQVRDAAEAIRNVEGKPLRVTLMAISRQLALPLDIFRRPDRLPRTGAVLTAEVESCHQHQLRKVAWAIRALGPEKRECAKSVLLRQAGIRKCVLTDAELSNMVEHQQIPTLVENGCVAGVGGSTNGAPRR